jgi:hypothetical protein
MITHITLNDRLGEWNLVILVELLLDGALLNRCVEPETSLRGPLLKVKFEAAHLFIFEVVAEGVAQSDTFVYEGRCGAEFHHHDPVYF